MAILVDNGIEKGDMSSIWFYGFLMLVAAFVSLWAGAKVESMRQSHRVDLRRILEKQSIVIFKTFLFQILMPIQQVD